MAVGETDSGSDSLVTLPVIYSSHVPIARTPDVIIEGSIIAEPDATNGIQKFRVVLKPTGAELG
jgi:hypothetical protein